MLAFNTHAIWDVCCGTGIDAYELRDPEAMHFSWSGISKYFMQDSFVVLKRVGNDAAMRELDRRAIKRFRYALKASSTSSWGVVQDVLYLFLDVL